jgi:hypothetical protein
MSVNQLTLDQRKPWLNVRVNNLTVDGTITGGTGTADTVRVSGTIPAGAPSPSLLTAILPSSFFPSTNSWYSAQFITFVTRDDNLGAKKSVSDVIFYVGPSYVITNIATSPYVVPIGLSIDYLLTYQSSVSLSITASIGSLSNAVAYRTALVISDVVQLA